MKQNDSYLANVFSEGVQVAYSRAKNLKDLLCRATLYPIHLGNTPRIQGYKGCSKHVSCKFSTNKKQIKCTATGSTFPILQNITCESFNVIYIIECKKCKLQYVGSTIDILRNRMDSHRSGIRNGTKNLYTHFQSRGHSETDFQFWGVELVIGDIQTLRQRERMRIDYCQVIEKGLNTNKYDIFGKSCDLHGIFIDFQKFLEDHSFSGKAKVIQ